MQPFRVGNPAVFLSDDPDGLRATRTAVLRVIPVEDGWRVDTAAGSEVVNQDGEGPRLVPLDQELAAEFDEHGPSFVVRASTQDRDQEQAYDWQRYEPEQSQEIERDRGHER